MYIQTGYLTPTAPCDLDKSLQFLQSFAAMSGEQSIERTRLTKAIYAAGQVVACQLDVQGDVEAPELAYTLYAEQPISEETKEAALDRISFFLSLDDNLRPLYQLAQDDADFSPIVQELYGYHQVKFGTPFEAACWAVLAQRNPRAMAQKMKQALLHTYGGYIVLDDTKYRVFPEARQLAEVSEAELQLVVKNTRKAEYLHAAIQAFKEADEQYLRTANYAEVETWLRSIRGFGAWSCEFILLRGLGRMEQAPVSEKALIEAASRLYGHGIELSRGEVIHLAEPYHEQQGYWAHYLRVGA